MKTIFKIKMTLSCDILQLVFVQNTRAIICEYYEHFWYVFASFVLKVIIPKGNVLRWDCFQGYFCYGDDAHKVIVVSWSCFFWLLMFKCEVCEKGFLLRRKLSLYARDHYRKGPLFLQILYMFPKGRRTHKCFITLSTLYEINKTISVKIKVLFYNDLLHKDWVSSAVKILSHKPHT